MQLLVFSLVIELPFLCPKQKKKIVTVSFLDENCVEFPKGSKSFVCRDKNYHYRHNVRRKPRI